MTPDEKVNKLEALIKIVDESLTRKEFVQSFEQVVKIIEQLKSENATEFTSIHQEVQVLAEKLKADNSDDLTEIKKECQTMMAEMMKEQTSNLSFMRDTVNRLRSGKDGKDGVNPNPAEVVPLVIAALPPDVEETGDQIVEKINSSESLISKDSVEGLTDLENNIKEIQIRPTTGAFGRSLLQLFVGGAKKGAIQYLNLIAGSGVTLTYSGAYGRNDITISASGGGSFAILTATGTINDSNKIFTFISAPKVVIVNGASYIDGAGVSIVGTTATLDNAVGTGGNIYGIG